eukprot:scaffold91887_cov39-Cyclotella_meneghiniana.AAC.1
MSVEGSQPAAFRCLSGVVATAAPDNQRNAGGAGPGLTTYRQPTIPFKVCFALPVLLCRGRELRDVPSTVARRPSPASNVPYHT